MEDPVTVVNLLLTAVGVLATVVVFLFGLYTREVSQNRRALQDAGEKIAHALSDSTLTIEANTRTLGKVVDAIRSTSLRLPSR